MVKPLVRPFPAIFNYKLVVTDLHQAIVVGIRGLGGEKASHQHINVYQLVHRSSHLLLANYI